MRKNAFFVSIVATVAMSGCSSGGPGGTTPTKQGGEYIDIPSCNDPHSTSLRINNRGLYVQCGDVSADTSTVHRLELGGPSPKWYAHQPGKGILGFEPTKRDEEKVDEFNIFYFNLDVHGFFGVNTGSPAQLETKNPNTGVAHVEHMLVDHSPSAHKWVFLVDGNGCHVNRIASTSAGGQGTFELATSLDVPRGCDFVEADDSDAFVWAGNARTLTQITVNGAVESVDLSKISPLTSMQGITKIRVKNGDAWVMAGPKLFRVKSLTDITLFAEVTGQNATLFGGSFAIDGNFVYLTDGRKIEVGTGKSTEFFSTSLMASGSMPNVEDFLMRSEFAASRNIEVSSDPLDPYVYMVSTRAGARILRITK